MSKLDQLVHQFNFQPEHYIHPTWYPAEWPAIHRDISKLGSKRAKARLGDMLRRIHGLNEFEFDFTDRARRIFLLPTPELETLATAIGLLIFQPYLLELAGKGRLGGIHDEFGRPLTTLIARRCPTVSFSSAVRAPPMEFAPLLRLNCNALGRNALAALSRHHSPAIAARLKLKYAQSAPAEERVSFGAGELGCISEVCLMCLLPEGVSSWDWLFC